MSRKIETLLKRMGIKVNGDKVSFGRGEPITNLYGVELKPFNIPEYNLRKMQEFDALLQSKGRKYYTRLHYLYPLAHLCHRIQKPLEKMTEQDLVGFVNSWVMDTKKFKTPATRNTYKRAIKFFFKWCLGKGKHLPECVEFIEMERVPESVTAEDCLSKEEIKMLCDCADHPQERLIPILLFETMFRRGELCSCRIRDLQFNPEGYATLQLPKNPVSENGVLKTGSYEALLLDSIPYLKMHLAHHPGKDNQDAPLLYSRKHSYYGKPLEPDGLYQIVRRLKKKSGISKRMFVHLFRHSANYQMAKDGYTREEINLASGRRRSSRAGDVYIHISGGDVKKKRLQRMGIIKPDEKVLTNPIQPIRCWSCGAENPGQNQVCMNDRCNMPLRLKAEQRERFARVSEGLLVAQTLSSLKKRKPKAYQELIGAITKVANALENKKTAK